MTKSMVSCREIIILLLFSLYLSCTHTDENKIAYISVRNTYNNTSIDTLPVKIQIIRNKENMMLNYFFRKDFEDTYIIDTSDYKCCTYFRNREQKVFVFVDSHFFEINGKRYAVYKYSSDYHAMDGCINHFYVPDIGFILLSSGTWWNYKKLWFGNRPMNDKVNMLVELIITNYKFYYGCVDENGIPERITLECYKDIPVSPPDSLNILDLVE